MSTTLSRKEARAVIHPKLRRSLRLYIGISLILTGVLVYDLVKYESSFGQVVLGLVVGVAVGVIIARMRKISWDNENGSVTSSMDGIGIFFLIVYIVLELNRERLVELVIQGPEVATVSMAVLVGVFYGRVLGNIRAVGKVLKEQGL